MWQPIETAPKDGGYFIAWDDRLGQMLFTMHWEADFQLFLTRHEAWSGVFTHWMPLPAPPAASEFTRIGGDE